MNDIRRTILWVIFGFSMVLLWDRWQVHNGHPATFLPTAPKPAAVASAPGGNGIPVAVPAPVAGGNNTVPNPVPTAAGAQTAVAAPVAGGATQQGQRVTVRTDVMELTFDTQGGSLVRTAFLKHKDMNDHSKPFVLLDESPSLVYMAQTGLIGNIAGVEYPTHKTVMEFSGERELRDGQDELVVSFTSPSIGGARLVKTYTLRRGHYDIAVRHAVTNTGAEPVTPQLYLQLVRDGNKPKGESSFYFTFTGPAVYTDATKFKKIDFADIKKGKADYPRTSSDGYVAMVQHYFASAWLLPQGMQRSISMDAVDIGSAVPDCCYRATQIAPMEPIGPGASKSVDAKLFVGPQEEKVLEALAPGLELVKDYGWLTILAKPLYWLLDKIHSVLGNWGWSIMGLVLLLKILFYWLNAKAYSSMAKMKAINPRITEMRERLKDNPQQMQQEMMKIYREEKVNPMGGCFPIMIQIPVFIALYWVLLSSVEMRNAPWVMWITDLSAPDPYFILPVFMTLTTLLQTALNPAPPDPMQAKLMWFMPLIFSVMFFFFPAGLVLYWITNNVLSIAQQWLINTRMGVPPQFNLPKF